MTSSNSQVPDICCWKFWEHFFQVGPKAVELTNAMLGTGDYQHSNFRGLSRNLQCSEAFMIQSLEHPFPGHLEKCWTEGVSVETEFSHPG